MQLRMFYIIVPLYSAIPTEALTKKNQIRNVKNFIFFVPQSIVKLLLKIFYIYLGLLTWWL